MAEPLRSHSFLRRARVTPATVVATVALALAAGGGAYAATTLGGHPIEWAVVTAGGKLARGKGAIGSSLLESKGTVFRGNYQVLFFSDVRNCAYKATLGNTDGQVPQVGQVFVAKRRGIVNGVYVRTTNWRGVDVDEGFHLAVIC